MPAVAKDLPKDSPKPEPSQVCPAPTQQSALQPSQQLLSAITGAAASVCALAASSGSFLVGAACGLVVVYGILRAQGK